AQPDGARLQVRRLGVSVALTCLLAGTAARADDRDDARARFKAGDYQGCVDALERAERVSRDPLLLWNMAACQSKLGRNAKAIGLVERSLAATATSLPADERARALDFLAAARVYVGAISVTSNVEGTAVSVDGELAGTTPFPKPVSVDE